LDLSHNRLGDAIAEALAEQVRPGRLERLSLAGNGIGARGCGAVAEEAVSGGLRGLDLSRNPLGASGAESLVQRGTLEGLIRLDVRRCQLTTDGMQTLLLPGHLPRLEQIWLTTNDIDDIPPQSDLSRLTLLDLSDNPLGEVPLFRLAFRPVPPRLTTLALAGCGVTPAALGALLRSGWLTRPAAVDLSDNPLGLEGIRALSRSADPCGLAALGLAACELDDLAMARLAKEDGLAELTCLHLGENPIGADGARALARADRLANLVALDLDRCPVGDAGAAELIDSPALDQLGMLSLRGCDLTDAGVEALSLSPGLARISRLALAGPDLGPASARALLGSPFTGALQVLTFQGTVRDPGLRRDLKERFGCESTYWPSSA
jgi:Leucine-rich repeat (LRR) protein